MRYLTWLLAVVMVVGLSLPGQVGAQVGPTASEEQYAGEDQYGPGNGTSSEPPASGSGGDGLPFQPPAGYTCEEDTPEPNATYGCAPDAYYEDLEDDGYLSDSYTFYRYNAEGEVIDQWVVDSPMAPTLCYSGPQPAGYDEADCAELGIDVPEKGYECSREQTTDSNATPTGYEDEWSCVPAYELECVDVGLPPGAAPGNQQGKTEPYTVYRYDTDGRLIESYETRTLCSISGGGGEGGPQAGSETSNGTDDAAQSIDDSKEDDTLLPDAAQSLPSLERPSENIASAAENGVGEVADSDEQSTQGEPSQPVSSGDEGALNADEDTANDGALNGGESAVKDGEEKGNHTDETLESKGSSEEGEGGTEIAKAPGADSGSDASEGDQTDERAQVDGNAETGNGEAADSGAGDVSQDDGPAGETMPEQGSGTKGVDEEQESSVEESSVEEASGEEASSGAKESSQNEDAEAEPTEAKSKQEARAGNVAGQTDDQGNAVSAGGGSEQAGSGIPALPDTGGIAVGTSVLGLAALAVGWRLYSKRRG